MNTAFGVLSYSAAFFAINSSGILDKLPGFEAMEHSDKRIVQELASGAVMALSEEGVRVVTGQEGGSYLLNGHYARYLDDVVFNAGISFVWDEAGINDIIRSTIGDGSDIAIALGVGTVIEASVLLRQYLLKKIATMPNGGQYAGIIYPVSWVAQKLGINS